MNIFDHRSGGHLDIDDAQIYVETVGAENRPVLVLLHGGFGSMEDFNVILPRLADRFRVVGIDSRGHGHVAFADQPEACLLAIDRFLATA